MANTRGDINVEIGARLDKIDKALSQLDQKLSKSSKRVEREVNGNMTRAFDSLKTTLIATFSVNAISNFLGEVVKTRAEFERYNAVLTNTLGSTSAAALAMADLEEFASKTPFALSELTGAYVKLVNQGFKPSIGQMEKLGDVAASTGKTFDQLAEAILDAQVGEFERLKEFGIRASKEGDKVTFTFKGVQEQVDFTQEAIQGYILSLGDAAGVSGAMASISETLGGKISNLGDSWDSFLNEIGKSRGYIGTIESLTQALQNLTDTAKVLNSERFGFFDKVGAFFSNFNIANVSGVANNMAIIEDVMNRADLEAKAAAEGPGGETKATKAIPDPKKLEAAAEAAHDLYTTQHQLRQMIVDSIDPNWEYLHTLEQQGEKALELHQNLNLLADSLEDMADELRTLDEIKANEDGIIPGINEDAAKKSIAHAKWLADNYPAAAQAASQAAAAFGSVVYDAFMGQTDDLNNFGEFFAKLLQRMGAQLAAAAAQALVFAAILSALGFGSFGKLFNLGFVNGLGFGGVGSINGGIKTGGTDGGRIFTASGDQLALVTTRSQTQFTRG